MKRNGFFSSLLVAASAVIIFSLPGYAYSYHIAYGTDVPPYDTVQETAQDEVPAVSTAAAEPADQKSYDLNSSVPAVSPLAEGILNADVMPVQPSESADVTVEQVKQEPEVVLNMHFKDIDEKLPETDIRPDASVEEEIADPLEPLNRAFFVFNDKLYFWALKPIAGVYGQLVPEWGRTRISNMFENIKAPIRLVSALLQFKMHKFGAEFAKFILNSTVGIAGMFDIAARHPELNKSAEDLGQTFGFWGMGEGFYLVIPLLGPSSLRDAAGTAGDFFLNPVHYITPFQDAVAVRSFDRVNETSFKIGDYEDIKEAAIDPYVSIRDIYKQYRRSKIRE